MQEIVFVVNRTTKPLEVMDDGRPVKIAPGYKRDEAGNVVGAGPNGQPHEVPLSYFAAERAMRQNPLMGSQDPMNPRATTFLVGVPKWGNDCSPQEQSDAIELLDRSRMSDEAQTATVRHVPGGRSPRVPGKEKAPAPFEAGRATLSAGPSEPAADNPTGIRLG